MTFPTGNRKHVGASEFVRDRPSRRLRENADESPSRHLAERHAERNADARQPISGVRGQTQPIRRREQYDAIADVVQWQQNAVR